VILGVASRHFSFFHGHDGILELCTSNMLPYCV
jgi:hypothetical protein